MFALSKFVTTASFAVTRPGVIGCEVNTKHSSFLHPRSDRQPPTIGTGNYSASTEESSSQVKNQDALNGFVRGRNERRLCEDRDKDSITGLAIVPVKIKANRCGQTVQTYAFLDSGSQRVILLREVS